MLLYVIKRGCIVFFIGLLSACGSGSTDPDPQPTNEKVIVSAAAPEMLKTEAQSGINLLSWSAQPDVTYTLYHRLISEPSSSWLEVESGLTAITYEHSLVNSHLYEYAVSAVNSGGESPKQFETTVIPQLKINSLSKPEGDEGVTTPFEFDVTLNRAAMQAITVSYKTVMDSATEDDYLPVSDGEITFSAGNTRTSISISIIGDSAVENNENFYIQLSDTNTVVLEQAEVTVTILNDDEPPVPVVTRLEPLSVTVNTEVDFTVTGQFLTEQIRLEIEDCSSAILLVDGGEGQQKFRCTISKAGLKSAKVLSTENEVLKAFEIDVIPATDILATGGITQPIADGNHEGDIEIAANAMDTDGLKKVSINFKSSDKKVILCSNDCTGNSASWATTINPSAYYDATSDSITLELWVLDMNDNNVQVDEVTFQWRPVSQSYSLRLNDTGVTKFFNENSEVSEEPLDFSGQDASFGRDVVASYNEDGHAGFSFTKIDSNGDDLPASALEWSCVRDNVTNLIWESKTNDGGPHDKGERFSWWKDDDASRGYEDRFKECNNYSSDSKNSYCNTEAYIIRVNSAGLCGLNQWRLPMKRELVSLINSEQIAPAIDVDWFPNTASDFYWARQPSAGIPGSGWDLYSWGVNFNEGFVDGVSWSQAAAVRLVHSVQ